MSNTPGAGPTSGPVTVTEMVPAGLTLVSMAGAGWTCSGTTCARSDALMGGASYPAITVTVNISPTAPGAVTNAVGVSGGTSASANATDLTNIGVSAPLQFVPVTACRIMDSRGNGFSGPFGPPSLAAGTTRTVPVQSSGCAIPAGAVAYSLNITVVPKTGFLGYVSAWPTGQTQPVVSTLNSQDGAVLANAAIVPAGVNGAIDLYVTNGADVIVDINGYFTPPAAGTLQFYPLAPCRVLDTRNPDGTFGGPSLSSNSRSFPVPASGCGIPPNAAVYSMNLTVIPKGSLGYLTAWPTGQMQPLVSTLNSLDGRLLANAAVVSAGINGEVSFYAFGTTDLVVDINGYFAPPGAGGLNFYALRPCRVVDTRNAAGPLGGPIMSGGEARSFPLTDSACGLPSTASAYSLNATVVPSGYLGYLTLWPTGITQPLVSTLNDNTGVVLANAAIVKAGTNGAASAYVTNSSHVIIDTNGYFAQ